MEIREKYQKPGKGHCSKKNPFRGIATVSEKGQIAIPKDLRDELGIRRGQKLILIRRRDGRGFNAFKIDILTKRFSDLTGD